MYKLDYFCAKQIMTARPRDAHFSHFSREREMVLRDISREKCGCEKLRENRPFLANFWSNLTKIWPKLEVLSYKVISVLLSITLTVEFWWSYWSFNRIYDLLYFGEKFIKKIASESVLLQSKLFLAFLARNGSIFLASREKWKTREMCISS